MPRPAPRRLAVALPLAAVAAATLAVGLASAEEITVDGCYGAGPAVFCDITVTYGEPVTVTTSRSPVPVCAGSCSTYYVPIPKVKADGDPLAPCVTWNDPSAVECRYPEDQ